MHTIIDYEFNWKTNDSKTNEQHLEQYESDSTIPLTLAN